MKVFFNIINSSLDNLSCLHIVPFLNFWNNFNMWDSLGL
jgi:hypothetical protein